MAETHVHCVLHRVLDVSILQDYRDSRATKLKYDRLDVLAAQRTDDGPHVRRAREADLANMWVGNHGFDNLRKFGCSEDATPIQSKFIFTLGESFASTWMTLSTPLGSPVAEETWAMIVLLIGDELTRLQDARISCYDGSCASSRRQYKGSIPRRDAQDNSVRLPGYVSGLAGEIALNDGTSKLQMKQNRQVPPAGET